MLFGLAVTGPAATETTDRYLLQQLSSIARFSELQAPVETSNSTSATALADFIKVINNPDFDDEKTSESLINFSNLVFAGDSLQSSSLMRVLQICGRLQFAKETPSTDACIIEPPPSPDRHFSGHVKEAIFVNKTRAAFYSKLSNGRTKSLSRLYTSMEYAILPLSSLIDRWALRLNKSGIPVLVNDFVSMSGVNPAEAGLLRTGILNATGRAELKEVLSTFQKGINRHAGHKDFLQAELQAITTLHDLRKLELKYNCNLALSIHIVESIGLATRNARQLGQSFNGRSDNFYRVFILLQNAGVMMFAKVDLKAQPFHKQQIGIIVNDLPPIPFP